MSFTVMRGIRGGVMLLAGGSILAGAASAQDRPNLPEGAVVQPLVRDDGAELRGYLTRLAENPRSVDALVGAGRAAMRTGDIEAALTFFGRADVLSPRDPRVKAGMASGLLQMGQPQAALSLFAESLELGAPEVEIAGDRGLAYDLVGDPQRAQRDYLTSLRHRQDPEIERRLALSLAISGQRDPALRLIDGQLRAHDRAGRRTQAFILALTGDASGATQTARAVMLPGQADAMAPFLARLATLNPAQKAMAVHLGRFPTSGQPPMATAATDVSADPGAVALAMGGPAPAAPQAAPAAEPAQTSRRRADRRQEVVDRSRPAAPRFERRRQREASAAASRAAPAPAAPAPSAPTPAAASTQLAEAGPRWSGSPYPAQSAPAPASTPQSRPGLEQASAIPASASPSSPPPAAAPAPPAQAPAVRPVELPPSASATSGPASTGPSPGFSLGDTRPDNAPSGEAEPAFADIAALVRNLAPEAAERRPAQPFTPPRPAPVAEASSAPARAARPARAEPAHPSRHWVQIAGGANRAALPNEFARLRSLAPDQLRARRAYTATLRATNRLLVGPFGSPREAQDFVNQLARHNVAAFAWTSEAGEAVERLRTP